MLMKTIRLYKELETRAEEENQRTESEGVRKQNLAKKLKQSYDNNLKLWSLITLSDAEKKKFGIQ